MTDPKAEALATLAIEHDICCLGAGYDARDEEVARLVWALRQMIGTHGEPCVHHPCEALTNARAALAAADRKAP